MALISDLQFNLTHPFIFHLALNLNALVHIHSITLYSTIYSKPHVFLYINNMIQLIPNSRFLIFFFYCHFRRLLLSYFFLSTRRLSPEQLQYFSFIYSGSTFALLTPLPPSSSLSLVHGALLSLTAPPLPLHDGNEDGCL